MKTEPPLFALIASALVLFGCESQAANYGYQAAMYTDLAGVSQDLQVFPFDGNAFSLPLPFALGIFAYGPDGETLFATDGRDSSLGNRGLFKIELDSMHVNGVAGSIDLGFSSIAVSKTAARIIFSGRAPGTPCGVFELTISSGQVRKIVDDRSCSPLDPASYRLALNLSPDGARAVALRQHHLELVDLQNGNVKVLRDDIELGSWSPDGKWLAVIDPKLGQTLLLDAKTMELRKAIGRSGLVWSPDSRFLLGVKHDIRCGFGEAGTLETLDVNTGQRMAIDSSRCLINRQTYGWISSTIHRE